jgi:hypothetical protein
MENGDQYTEKFIRTMAKPNQEAVALLSVKYDLQPGTVEAFLDRYLADTDIGYKLLKDSLRASGGEASKAISGMELLVLEKESYSQALANASQSVGITMKTAVLLVSDYRMFTARGKGSE